MLDILLFLYLDLAQADYPPGVFDLNYQQKSQLIELLQRPDYQPLYQTNRSLPPLMENRLVKPSVPITARSSLVVDLKSGIILHQQNPDRPLPIASLTKLMTAQVFLSTSPDLDQEYVMDKQDNDSVIGSRLNVVPGEIVRIRDLLAASLIGSANNATQALAHSTGLTESEFIALMNKKTVNLGLTQTFFKDVTGLDPGNVSTAAEYTKLARAAFQYPIIKQYLGLLEYTFETIDRHISHRIKNTNLLLGNVDFEIVGAKTGYLDEAGYTFVSQASLGGHDIIVVLFHSQSGEARFAEAKSLVRWVYDNFKWL